MCILTVAIGKEEIYSIFNACFDELNRNMYLKCGKQFSLSQTCLWVSGGRVNSLASSQTTGRNTAPTISRKLD